MKRWAILAIAVLALGGLGAVTSGAGKQQKVKTKVTVTATGGSPATGLEGKVKARRHGHKVRKCRKGRKVVVKHAGAKVGADRTNKKGKWAVAVDPYAEPGKYTAKAKRKNPAGPLKCRRGKASITL